MFEAARRAEAMGIVEPGLARVEPESLRQLAGRVRGAGIATSAADVLRNVAGRRAKTSPRCSS